MKRMQFAKILFLCLIVYYVIYNYIFGWNKTPESGAEKICDRIFGIGAYFSLYFYISPIIEWVEKRVNEDDTIL